MKKETRGRKSNASKGIECAKTTSVRIKPSIQDKAVQIFGSLSAAIEFAIEQKESCPN